MKQFILRKLGKIPDKLRGECENTELHDMVCAPLRFRLPWELLTGNITKGNICVAGDALHPMTPDLGQGGCSALEDAVVLARVLGEAFNVNSLPHEENNNEQNEQQRISQALEKFARERRWRSFKLVGTAYMLGYLQQNYGFVLNFFLRDKMAKFFVGILVGMAHYDCGKLNSS